MESKKFLVLGAALLSVAALAGCGSKYKPDEKVSQAIADAQTLSHDELFKKAAAELGTSGVLKIAATTSRGGKDKVKNLFISELQKHNASITDKQLVYDTFVDGEIYEKIQVEIEAGVKDGYAGTITQDGYQLQKKGIDTGYYQNFVPKTWKEAAGVDLSAQNPFTLQYNFKTWMYNVKDKVGFVVDNVWDVTDSSFKGKIDTMDPRNENVNMDWLIQLTSDEQNKALKEAYEDSTRNSDVNLDNYSKYGEKKYAYAFIDKFIENAVFFKDDGEAMTHLANTPGNVGWIVYSKLLKVEETAAISKKNIVVAALGQNNTDGSKLGASNIKGFAGFMYKHYLQVLPQTSYPYAACAFFELISTNATAYSVWASDVGDYPTLPSINMDRTKNGNNEAGETLYPCLNDPTSNWWINNGKAVVETPSFIGSNYDTVIPAIDAAIAAKK